MKIQLFISFLFIKSLLFAQNIEDTSKTVHPYKKSMLFSAVLPGGGQIRNSLLSNKKIKNAYWKVPLIYGALGSSLYMVIDNHVTQKRIKDEYFSREAGNDPSLEWINYDSYGLISLQQLYLNNRDLFILLTLGIHGLQILDAGVEAHFINFNVDKDLSIQIKPKIYQNSILLSANFKFK